MHLRTNPKPESRGQAGRWQSEYHDTMIDHDQVVGTLLYKLEELGVVENTIVLYSTDNGPHMNSWPGKIASGTVSNEIVSHLDWLPTFLAAAGDPDVKVELLEGHQAGGKTSAAGLS